MAQWSTRAYPGLESDINATEVILLLAPETNGEVDVKDWAAHWMKSPDVTIHLALLKEKEKIRFRDIVAQSREDYLFADMIRT